MFVCLCNGVTDTQIKHAIQIGCDSLKKIKLNTGAMTQCCKCCDHCKDILASETLTNSHHVGIAVSTPPLTGPDLKRA